MIKLGYTGFCTAGGMFMSQTLNFLSSNLELKNSWLIQDISFSDCSPLTRYLVNKITRGDR